MSTGQIAITIIPMVTGTLSIAASSTIIVKVLQSQSKLTTPYNRLLIGLCAFDIILSICHVSSTLPVTRGTPGYWGTIGNATTCQIQGFMFLFSIVSTPFYNLALCIYFLCVIKFSMTDERFRRILEPYLHGIPILYGLGTAVYTLSIGYINPSTTMCWIAPPDNLRGDDFSKRLAWIINGGPILAIFMAIIVIMCMILWSVYSQAKTMERYRFQLNSGIDPSPRNSARSQENASRSRNRVKAVQTRAKWFFAAYIITYAPTFVFRIIASIVGARNVHISIIIIARALFPLQGVFNMCAHLQPQAASIQRENPEYWYIQALYAALIRLNTDLDTRNSGTSRRRRSSSGSLGRRFSTSHSRRPAADCRNNGD